MATKKTRFLVTGVLNDGTRVGDANKFTKMENGWTRAYVGKGAIANVASRLRRQYPTIVIFINNAVATAVPTNTKNPTP